jgi:DNA-binding transcriptional LysR family regulator
MHFYRASELGSFQAAARLLRTTASAISYSVNDLENMFQTDLFIRSKSGVKLTYFGKELTRFAKRYFSDLDDLYLKAQNKENQIEKIRIGTFSSMAMYVGPTLLNILNTDRKLVASITTNRSHALFESVLKRDIDIAISVQPPIHTDIKSIQLYSDKYGFFISRDTKLRNLNVMALKNHSLLYMPEATGEKNKPLSQYMREFNLKFGSEFEFNSFEVIKEYCSKGLGIGILPLRVAKFYSKQIKKISIESIVPEFGEHSFSFSYRQDSEIKSKTMDFILETLKETID